MMTLYKSRDGGDPREYVKVTDLIEWMNECGKFDNMFIPLRRNRGYVELTAPVTQDALDLEDEMYYIPADSKVMC